MTDFDYDVYQKKRLARGYRNKKNGSKSKRCSLPSDRMTKKQWKERNSKVVSYNLNKPMSWVSFKEMPFDLQTEYINNLREKYGTTAADLGRFFDCDTSTITKYCKRNLGFAFGVGQRMSKKQKEMFAEFCKFDEDDEGEKPIEESCAGKGQEGFEVTGGLGNTRLAILSDDSDYETGYVPKREPPYHTVSSQEENRNPFKMRRVSLSFNGDFDANALRNSLYAIIGEGRPVSLNIECIIE